MSYFPDTLLAGYETLQASAYDRTCSVQALAVTEPTPGDVTRTWTDVATAVPCSVSYRAATEVVRAGQLDAEQGALVKMDYRPDVDAGSRIVLDGGETLEVVGQPEDVQGMGRWLHLACRRVENVGAE